MKYTDLTREQLERIKEHAPELLEALENLLSISDPIGEQQEYIVKQARDIINRAKGE